MGCWCDSSCHLFSKEFALAEWASPKKQPEPKVVVTNTNSPKGKQQDGHFLIAKDIPLFFGIENGGHNKTGTQLFEFADACICCLVQIVIGKCCRGALAMGLNY